VLLPDGRGGAGLIRHIPDIEIRCPRSVRELCRVKRDDIPSPDLIEFRMIRGFDIVGASVYAIDDTMQPVTHLIAGEPLADHPADDGFANRTVHGVLVGATLGGDAVVLKRPVHGLDDLVALAELLQRIFGIGGQRPPPWLDLVGEA
jgi:hypothetical protein